MTSEEESSSKWRESAPYHSQFEPSPSSAGASTLKIYFAACFCGRVKYQVLGDPLSSKLCHCRGCQTLHGAPFEWVAIFPKTHVRFSPPSSLDHLYFYNSEIDQGWASAAASERILPTKVSCSHCRTPIADEGRNMWLAYCPLFGFTSEGNRGIPNSFQHQCHLFYSQRSIDMPDDKTKWMGHKEKSARWKGRAEKH